MYNLYIQESITACDKLSGDKSLSISNCITPTNNKLLSNLSQAVIVLYKGGIYVDKDDFLDISLLARERQKYKEDNEK